MDKKAIIDSLKTLMVWIKNCGLTLPVMKTKVMIITLKEHDSTKKKISLR